MRDSVCKRKQAAALRFETHFHGYECPLFSDNDLFHAVASTRLALAVKCVTTSRVRIKVLHTTCFKISAHNALKGANWFSSQMSRRPRSCRVISLFLVLARLSVSAFPGLLFLTPLPPLAKCCCALQERKGSRFHIYSATRPSKKKKSDK